MSTSRSPPTTSPTCASGWSRNSSRSATPRPWWASGTNPKFRRPDQDDDGGRALPVTPVLSNRCRCQSRTCATFSRGPLNIEDGERRRGSRRRSGARHSRRSGAAQIRCTPGRGRRALRSLSASTANDPPHSWRYGSMPSEQTGAGRTHTLGVFPERVEAPEERSRVFRISNTLRTQAMPHNKADLIAAIAFNRKLSIGRADAIVNQIFTAIAETLVRGDGIEIRGFGSFTVRHYGAYEGRNPRTGAPSYVKAKRLP